MTTIFLDTAFNYPAILDHVMKHGEKRSPRGISTRDAGLCTIEVHDPALCLPLGIGRKINPRIAAVEAIQLIAGWADTELVLRIAPQFEKYTDLTPFHQRYFHGAYGDRIASQMRSVARKLLSDHDTRQAIVTLWDPSLDNEKDKHDYPCTIAFVFAIRNNGLDMNIFMRSSDAWLGIPYDIFQFAQLQATLALNLGYAIGTLRLTTASLHIYESDVETVNNVKWNYHNTLQYQPYGVGINGQSMNQTMIRARRIMKNDIEGMNLTESENWYVEQLHARTNDTSS